MFTRMPMLAVARSPAFQALGTPHLAARCRRSNIAFTRLAHPCNGVANTYPLPGAPAATRLRLCQGLMEAASQASAALAAADRRTRPPVSGSGSDYPSHALGGPLLASHCLSIYRLIAHRASRSCVCRVRASAPAPATSRVLDSDAVRDWTRWRLSQTLQYPKRLGRDIACQPLIRLSYRLSYT